MNNWFIFLLFGSILVTVLSRPYQEEYSNDSDAEDDYKEPGAEDSITNEEESSVNEQISDSSLTGKVHNDRSELTKVDESSIKKQRRSDRFDAENTEPQHFQQNINNHEVDSADAEENEEDSKNIKRTARFKTSPIEEGETIFQKNKDPVDRVEKNGYFIDRSRYNKKNDNTMEEDNKDMIDDQSQDGVRYNQRDRRDINSNEAEKPSTTGNQIVEKIDSADESAIKRHIKKLSEDELNALLDSLSEDKRELLKKVISDVDINKREITKKAGAVEENNLVENSASDLSKVEIEPALDLSNESASHKDFNEINKPSSSDNNELLMRKNAEITTSSLNKQEDFLNVDSKVQEEKAPIEELHSKLESKREAKIDNIEDFNIDDSKIIYSDSGSDYTNDHEYLSPQDENNLSKLANDNQIYNENKAYKRDTYQNNIKSLEESFPNSNSYSESESYSAPLVRVKRRNRDQNVKKRSAGVMPDAKVAYFPYKAENEDEDSDEGNEFDDEGFYDRTSNFGNSDKDLNALTKDNLKSPNAVDTMSLGSDTDSVLSGVEGVDDNLMYSSGSRNRRIADNNSNDLYSKNKVPSLVDNKKKSMAENYINAAQYQENDAFGPLPRNYDGDLSRYKRIRRVKEPNNSGEHLSDN